MRRLRALKNVFRFMYGLGRTTGAGRWLAIRFAFHETWKRKAWPITPMLNRYGTALYAPYKGRS